MLTDKTQAAIAALRAVAYCVPHSSPDASPSVPVRMLRDLEDCGLIRLLPGGNPSLSAINAENQQNVKQAPNFTPKSVKLGAFVLFKIYT